MHLVARGLIPAHAGKTKNLQISFLNSPAHPRSRGENAYALFRARRYKGSSLLTRGKPVQPLPAGCVGGLIPAHAGKTGSCPGARTPRKAHPRSRGENPPAGHPNGYSRGSSPLTRGKRRERQVRTMVIGLIPAHAGKTPCPSRSTRSPRAHPRSRGENSRVRPRRDCLTGSSPLTRGKHAGTGPRA